MTMDIDLELAIDTIRRALAAAAEVALGYFRTDLTVERKADDSPVTRADRETEAAIVAVIRDAFPDHALLTEESGAFGDAGSGYRWTVDPIDGTRGFTRGGPFWGPLIALQAGQRVVAGGLGLPALGDTYWAARGMGCFKNEGTQLHVSKVDRWSDAVLGLGELPFVLAEANQPGVQQLIDGAYLARCYGDLAGCAQVLEGRADAWLEVGVKIWDVAPAQVLIEEAGGRFTDLCGHETIESGSAIATNGLVHDHILNTLGTAESTHH